MSPNIPKKPRWVGTFRADEELRNIVAEMLRDAANKGKARAQIATEMSANLGRPVSPAMLAEFTRTALQRVQENVGKPTKHKRYVGLPASWVPALSTATGSDKLVRHLLDSRNRELLELAERQHLKFDWALQRLERLYSKIHETKAGRRQKLGRKKRTPRRPQ